MSLEPIENNFIDKIVRQNINPKDYEKIILNNYQHLLSEKDAHDTTFEMDNLNTSKWRHFKNKFLQVLQPYIKSKVETQLDVFQGSMKYCLVIGQCIGLFPIMRIRERDLEKKYNILSWRYFICITILLAQVLTTALNSYRMLVNKFCVTTAYNFLFFTINFITNVQFVRLSTKWHQIMKIVVTSNLDEYVDPYVKIKCNIVVIFLLTFALINHTFFIISPFIKMLESNSDYEDAVKKASLITFPWIFDVIVGYSHGTMIIVQFLAGILTIIWNHSQIFIICISLFLTSVLESLNKKIISRENQVLPASYWRAVRQDYNRAIRLVHFFDDNINGIIFVSFATNLFFVCCRIYYLLVGGYEDLIFNLSSAMFYITRAFLVSCTAAKIHSASLVVAPSLYKIPSSSFCTEVHRFLDQINGTTVALTGLKFFYVTKELILSIIGTVITYELVLLQFK